MATDHSEFKEYQTQLTRVEFSYLHLVDNLVLDEHVLTLLYQASVLDEEHYKSFLEQYKQNKPYKSIAREFVNYLLTKMKARGECFRDPKVKRKVEEGRRRVDYYEKFMEVRLYVIYFSMTLWTCYLRLDKFTYKYDLWLLFQRIVAYHVRNIIQRELYFGNNLSMMVNLFDF